MRIRVILMRICNVDPGPHESDANLQHRSKLASKTPFVSLHITRLFTLMPVRLRLFTLTRIPASQNDADPYGARSATLSRRVSINPCVNLQKKMEIVDECSNLKSSPPLLPLPMFLMVVKHPVLWIRIHLDPNFKFDNFSTKCSI